MTLTATDSAGRVLGIIGTARGKLAGSNPGVQAIADAAVRRTGSQAAAARSLAGFSNGYVTLTASRGGSVTAHAHANGTPAIELAGMFTESLHPRVGGRFASKGGAPVAAARARHSQSAPAIGRPLPAPGGMTHGQQLRYQAASDRHLAQQITIKIAALVRERDAAVAGLGAGKASAPVNAARSAAAKKAAITRKAGLGKSKTAGKTASVPKTRVQRLNGQIGLLRNDARLLIRAAQKLDRLASGQ